MTMKEFLSHCTACGGNWTAMIGTGIRELFPDEWNNLPDTFEFEDVMEVLKRKEIK